MSEGNKIVDRVKRGAKRAYETAAVKAAEIQTSGVDTTEPANLAAAGLASGRPGLMVSGVAAAAATSAAAAIIGH